MSEREFPDLSLVAEYVASSKYSQQNPLSLLEIGSGAGDRLAFLCNLLTATGIGIEPSELATKIANQTFHDQGCQYLQGTSDNLPFNDNSFDLVFFGFCLYLIDRSLVDQTINEADRVLKKGGFLAIIDFDPPTDMQNPYIHYNGIISFKMQYWKLFLPKGYELVMKLSLSESGDIAFERDENKRTSICLLYKR